MQDRPEASKRWRRLLKWTAPRIDREQPGSVPAARTQDARRSPAIGRGARHDVKEPMDHGGTGCPRCRRHRAAGDVRRWKWWRRNRWWRVLTAVAAYQRECSSSALIFIHRCCPQRNRRFQPFVRPRHRPKVPPAVTSAACSGRACRERLRRLLVDGRSLLDTCHA